jgi:DNA-binding GntR family transcriptional regulator
MAVNWEDFESRRGAVPVYVQLADFIQAAIERGDLGHGDQIPAERRLSELTGHSAETAGKAKRLLTERGLVETGHGTGTFVRLALAPRKPRPPKIGEKSGTVRAPRPFPTR